VDRAVVTHAHGDHARWGCRAYVGSVEGERGCLHPLTEMGDRVYAVALDEVVEVTVKPRSGA